MKIKIGATLLNIRANGSFESIINPETGLNIIPEPTTGYPFAALVRECATGYFEWILINKSYRGTCRITKGRKSTRLSFSPLTYANGRKTSLSIHLDLSADSQALAIEPTVEAADESFELQELVMFHGQTLDLDEPAHERVAIPDWGEGKIIHNPRHAQTQTVWFGPYFLDNAHHYSYTAENGMDLSYGWMATYGRRCGLALAFINEKMLTMEFKLSRSENGLGMSAIFFRLRTYAETIAFRQTQPLRLGKLLLIPLAGDWHHAADVYRREYDKVFGADLPIGTPSAQRAKSLDVNLHYGILGAHAQTAQSALNVSFSDVVRKVKDFIRKHKVAPSRVMVWLYGIGAYGHDRTNPTQRPILGAAGGQEGFVKMSREFQKMGIGAHVEYTHPWATQQNQLGYDPLMDTGKSHKMMGVVMHNALCLDDQRTQDFYKEKVFKPFKSDGVTDMFLDQATLCMGMCQRPHHDHGTDAEGILGAHARGTVRMDRNIRSIFGSETFLSTESHNDLGCRMMEMAVSGDCFSSRWAFENPAFEIVPEINHYTHPEILRMVNHGPATILPLIAIHGCNSMLSQLKDADDAIRRYLAFKDKINESGIGYPYGFRDTIGLSWSGGNLQAKIFMAAGEGLTVTYYATVDTENVIRVDLSRFGSRGIWEIPLNLKAGEYGFQTKKDRTVIWN